MPLPKPKDDESKGDFMDRCMADPAMVEEFDDAGQRYAVCLNQWKGKGESMVTANIERRCLPGVEVRIDADKPPIIAGYAAVFGKLSEDLGGFREIIEPGAFADVLKAAPDVRALVNHDPNQRLGRTKAGTLRLREDPEGLRVEIDPPDTEVGRDAVQGIKRGDLDGMSFSFRVKDDRWEKRDGADLRIVMQFERLYDVGPVTFPAYRDTSVAVRSHDAWRAAQEPPPPAGPSADVLDRQLRLAEAE